MLSTYNLFEQNNCDELCQIILQELLKNDKGFNNLVESYIQDQCPLCLKEILESIDPLLLEGIKFSRTDYSLKPKTSIGKAWHHFQKYTGIGKLRSKIGNSLMTKCEPPPPKGGSF